VPTNKHLILCVEEDPFLLRTREMVLQSEGYRVVRARTVERGVIALRDLPVTAVLLGYTSSESALRDAMARIRATKPRIPILLLKGFPDDPGAESSASVFNTCDGPLRLLEAVAILTGEAKPVTLVSFASTLALNRRTARK